MKKKIILYLIKKFLPGYHLSKSPAKGTKRARKAKD